MKLEDLLRLYDTKKKAYGDQAYLHISEMFEEARDEYKEEYLRSDKASKKREKGEEPDAEQSWKPFKGHNFEKLILRIVQSELSSDTVKCIPGSSLGGRNLTAELSKVHRNLIVRYGSYSILPDADLVLYSPSTCRVLGVISCKTTLRERIAQTAYWKLKLAADPVTVHIQGFLVTPDEDGDLDRSLAELDETSRSGRNRIIVEHELDGTYVLRRISESAKVKAFPKLIEDVRRLVSGQKT